MRGRTRHSHSRQASEELQEEEQATSPTPAEKPTAFLGLRETEKLNRLPTDVLVAAAVECGLAARERALLVLGRVSSIPAQHESAASALEALTQQLAKQEMRSLEAWRKRYQQLANRRSKYVAELDVEDLKKRALELAKDGQLSPTENLLLFTAIHADEEDRRLMAALICCEADADRMAMFNYHLAAKKGEAYLSQHGQALESLTMPLFPGSPEYDLLNTKLLREFGDASVISGGAAPFPPRQRSSVHRQHRSTLDILGGGTLPVVPAQDGSWVVDATAIENGFQEIFSALRQLQQKVDTAKQEKAPETTMGMTTAKQLHTLINSLRRTVNTAKSTLQKTQTRIPRTRQAPRGGEAESENF